MCIPGPLQYTGTAEDVLRDDRAGIIVRHDMFRTNHNIISGFDDLSNRKPNSILLYHLLDHSLRYLCRVRREQPDAS